MTWKHWFEGLVAALVGGAANAVTLIVVDPLAFNLQAGWKNLATACAVSSLVNLAMYLKQSPIPKGDD